MSNISKLEALLFYYGEPVSRATVARLLSVSEEECENIIQDYKKLLIDSPDRGLLILEKDQKIQLATKPELKEIGEAIIKEEFRESLTPAALETLALVAYLGPIPRSTIDYIRGVNSGYSMRNLSMRGLIERGEEKGASFRYFITQDFLKHMGLSSIHELPEYEKYHALLETFARTQQEGKVESGTSQKPVDAFDMTGGEQVS